MQEPGACCSEGSSPLPSSVPPALSAPLSSLAQDAEEEVLPNTPEARLGLPPGGPYRGLWVAVRSLLPHSPVPQHCSVPPVARPSSASAQCSLVCPPALLRPESRHHCACLPSPTRSAPPVQGPCLWGQDSKRRELWDECHPKMTSQRSQDSLKSQSPAGGDEGVRWGCYRKFEGMEPACHTKPHSKASASQAQGWLGDLRQWSSGCHQPGEVLAHSG